MAESFDLDDRDERDALHFSFALHFDTDIAQDSDQVEY